METANINKNIKDFKLMIIPGNGCDNINDANWYYWLATKLKIEFPQADIICRTMPDPYEAKEEYWIPFIKENLKFDGNTYVVGLSSGAVAIMRLLETFIVKGVVLVSACVTHLGMESEKIAGYYPEQPLTDVTRPWKWD